MAGEQQVNNAYRSQVQKRPGAVKAGLRGDGEVSSADVPGDQFGHLEHTDLALAVKYRLELIVSIDLSSLFLVLKAMLLYVIPKFFGHFRTRQRFGAHDRSQFIVRLDRSHEGGVWFTFRRSLGFRHRG